MRTKHRDTLIDIDAQLTAWTTQRDRARTPDEWHRATVQIDALLERRHELAEENP